LRPLPQGQGSPRRVPSARRSGTQSEGTKLRRGLLQAALWVDEEVPEGQEGADVVHAHDEIDGRSFDPLPGRLVGPR